MPTPKQSKRAPPKVPSTKSARGKASHAKDTSSSSPATDKHKDKAHEGKGKHKLMRLVGEWNTAARLYPLTPTTETMHGKASIKADEFVGDVLLREEYSQVWEGQAYHGLAQYTYVERAQKFQMTWTDNTRSLVRIHEGSPEFGTALHEFGDADVLEMRSHPFPDFRTGEPKVSHHVHEFRSPDEFVMMEYRVDRDGGGKKEKLTPEMEVVYTRSSSSSSASSSSAAGSGSASKLGNAKMKR